MVGSAPASSPPPSGAPVESRYTHRQSFGRPVRVHELGTSVGSRRSPSPSGPVEVNRAGPAPPAWGPGSGQNQTLGLDAPWWSSSGRRLRARGRSYDRSSLLTGVLGGLSRWLGRSWKFRGDERHGGSEARLLSHARKRHGKSRGIAASRNCRSVYNALDAQKQRHNRERLILRNSICEAVFRIQPFRFARRSLQVVHGRQDEIIEIPTVGFEAFQEIAAPTTERVFHGAPHVTGHRGVAVVEEFSAGRGRLTPTNSVVTRSGRNLARAASTASIFFSLVTLPSRRTSAYRGDRSRGRPSRGSGAAVPALQARGLPPLPKPQRPPSRPGLCLSGHACRAAQAPSR